MKLKIETPKGVYKYKFNPVYNGVKIIDKVIAKENLLLFNKIAKAYSLRYFLCWGTLLGALREHDFIAHDEDIDLGVLSEDLDLFKSMLFELRENGFEVIRYDRRDGLCSIMRKGEYIDFYFYKKTCQGVRDSLGDSLPEKYVTDLKEIEFQGEQFLAPIEAEEFMLFYYGESWRTPIQTNNYEQPWYLVALSLIRWYIYFFMPQRIYVPWIKRREIRKFEVYNKQANRLNEILGRKEVPLINIKEKKSQLPKYF